MNQRIRVKICGITRVEDGIQAAALGADAIGLVFYAKSPRAVTIPQAQAIIAALPPFVSAVGLFVDAPAADIHDILTALPLDLLQFHGEESPDFCSQFPRPYLKAIHIKPHTDLAAAAQQYVSAKALLLDTYVPGVKGGTGMTFDWRAIPSNLAKPIILAGGLTADNVTAAIAAVKPYGVDVSGGVEASKGIKDPLKIAEFIARVSQVQCSSSP